MDPVRASPAVTAQPLFIVTDQGGRVPYQKEELSLPRGTQPGQWMDGAPAAEGKPALRRYTLTSYPLEDTDRWWMSTRIFLAEYRGGSTVNDRTVNGIQVRTVNCESIRILEEITPDWVGLPQRPDIRAALISQWRKENKDAWLPSWATLAGADLTRAYLRRTKLAEVDLRGAALSFTDLGSASLSYADLRDCNLENASLSNVDAEGASFGNANLRNTHLSYGKFAGANFANADLENAELNRARMMGADLRGANLKGVTLQWADLRFTYLQGVNLSGLSFTNVNLAGTDLRGVEISKAQLLECRQLDEIRLNGAVVDGVRLTAAAAATLIEELKVTKPAAFDGFGLKGLS